MNQTKTLRKLAIFVLIFAGLLTLAACKSGEKTPYGSISEDAYLTIGDITVTEKELYDQLRMQGASVLATMVDETIFADQVTTVRDLILDGDEDLNKYLDETINSAIHGTSDLEALEKLYTENPDRFVRNIEQFVDSLYLMDNSIDIAAVKASIQGLTGTYEGYANVPLLLDRYILRSTQRQYAKGLLEEEVLDEDDPNYITEANLVNYYTTTMQGRYDVDALVIRFINLNEANAALYQASIKSDSKGLWYKIPDIRITTGNPGYVDLNNETPTGNKHIVDILSDLGILSKLGEDREDRSKISVADYENYYKRYVISTTRETGKPDEALTAEQVKVEFVNIYNILNPANKVEIAVDGTIVAQAGSAYTSTQTYDDLTKLNASLRSHVYTTLTAEQQMEDINDLSTEKPFSSRVQTFGNFRYLVYKIDDESDTEEGILVESEDDADIMVFDDSDEAKAKRAEAFEKVVENKLTSTYISEKVSKLYEEKELNIYDKVVRAYYEQNYGYEGSTKDRSGDVIASIDGKDIKVDDFYDELEKSYGINLSLDILSNKLLLQSDDYVIEDSEMDTFKTQFEDIISQFSADNFASAGFPASMGREKFLLLAFGATTNQEAINQLYVYPELRQQYIDDIEAHYGTDDYTIYEKLSDLAALQYNKYKAISVSHLLIYFDENGDGSPDNPQEYLDGLDAASVQQIKDGLVDLVELIYSRVGNYTGHSAGLTAIATEFNNSGRIERGNVTTPPYDYQIELLWAQYRRLGFYLKFENISSQITNTSNFITNQSTLDPVFYNRAMAIHQELSEIEDDDAKFPLLDLYDDVITVEALDEVMSDFGWHLILANSTGKTTSAIFSESDDEDGKYVSADETLNVYNEDSETLTASQIEYYLKEQKSEEGVVLPTDVQTAVNSYLTPVLTRYNNNYMQRELIFKLVDGVSFSAANGMARFTTIRNINLRQLDEYMLSDEGVNDSNYADLYGTWFTILNSGL